MIEFACTRCRQMLRADILGATVRCPRCNQLLTVPGIIAAAPVVMATPGFAPASSGTAGAKWLLAGAVGTIFLLLLATILLYTRSETPTVAQEGERWTLEDVLRHLKSRRLEFAVVKGSVEYFESDDPCVAINLSKDDKVAADTVFIVRKKNLEAAQDFARRFGGGNFTWGRFVFCTHAEDSEPLLDSIRKALF